MKIDDVIRILHKIDPQTEVDVAIIDDIGNAYENCIVESVQHVPYNPQFVQIIIEKRTPENVDHRVGYLRGSVVAILFIFGLLTFFTKQYATSIVLFLGVVGIMSYSTLQILMPSFFQPKK